jgi:protein-disulfide isomerase
MSYPLPRSAVRLTALAVVLTAACSQGPAPPEPDQPAPTEAAARPSVRSRTAKSALAAVQGNTAPLAGAPAEPAAAEEAKPSCAGHEDSAVADESERVEIDLGDAPVLGRDDAPVTLVVFCDFECPFCARALRTLDKLEERYGSSLRIAFKNLPLPMHELARPAARAALAAAEQGRFWDYHDALFAGQRDLDDEAYERHAAALGLDMRRFRAALADERTARHVDADAEEAARLGVRGTPTFFVNGRKVMGAQPVATFSSLIDAELRSLGKTVPR